MQQDPSDPIRPSSTQEQEASAQGAKRSRQSSYTTESTEAGPSDAPTGSKYPSILNPSAAGQLGTTRDTADMYRSSTPPDPSGSGSIKYTRTGRVSKATKGQRVHNCEECGKTYTRAEHLRRHQQNHQPGAYPCDIPGCARSFYREDLLLRHKARHNDPRNPPSRRQSIGSLGSAPEGGVTASDATSASVPSNPSEIAASEAPTSTPRSDTQQSSEPSRAPKRLPVPPDQLSLGALPIAIEGTPALVPFTNSWRTSLSPGITNEHDYESSDDFSGLSYPHSYSARARYSSDASLVGYSLPHSTSRSPVSVGSSTLLPTQWPPHNTFGTDLDTCMLNQCTQPYFDPQSMTGLVYMNADEIMAIQRDLEEQPELELTHFASMELSVVDGTDHADLYPYLRYVDSYWSLVHELYPVLHKPTFNVASTSPLLRAAVLALGAQGLGERRDLSYAKTLHERCIKVLKKRTMHDTHTYRVCDMQAIFLIEVFALFKSRRPPLQFSGNFEHIFRRLLNCPSAIMRASSEPLSEDSFCQPDFGLGQSSIDTESKQRLLLSCYLLEEQCNSLFGRSSDIGFPGLCNNLPFPSRQATWDTPTEMQHSHSPPRERLADVFRILQCNPPQRNLGAFQSSLMSAWLCDDSNNCVDSANDSQLLVNAMEQSARARLIYHTAMMCKNTPYLRDLLAVAGESWIMSEKLSTETEFYGAQIEVRKWASGGYGNSQMIQEAVSHALKILAIHQQTPKTGLLYQEWAVYLAALVIWAIAYVLSDRRIAGPALTPAALERSVCITIRNGHGAVKEWAEVHNILLWTQMKLQQVDVPHTCGLVSGALDVLGKLVARGSEDGWA